MFNKILVANRGEIACRVIKSAQSMGIKAVAVYSDADKYSPHALLADEAIHIGESPAQSSYLDKEKIISAMKQSLKYSMPKLNNLEFFESFCNNSTQESKFICTCHNIKKIPIH